MSRVQHNMVSLHSFPLQAAKDKELAVNINELNGSQGVL